MKISGDRNRPQTKLTLEDSTVWRFQETGIAQRPDSPLKTVLYEDFRRQEKPTDQTHPWRLYCMKISGDRNSPQTKLSLEIFGVRRTDRNTLQTKLYLHVFAVWRYQETGVCYSPKSSLGSFMGGEENTLYKPDTPLESSISVKWTCVFFCT